MKLTIEQKQAFINENLEQFFASPKTSSEEYKNNFNAMDVEKQYAVVLRWKKYNEKKAEGTTTRTTKKTTSPIDMLLAGEKIAISNDDAIELQFKFKAAIDLLETIIEDNKNREKEELQEQIKSLQERLKNLK